MFSSTNSLVFQSAVVFPFLFAGIQSYKNSLAQRNTAGGEFALRSFGTVDLHFSC